MEKTAVAKELLRISKMLVAGENVTSAEIGDLDKRSREFVLEFLAKRKEVEEAKGEIKRLSGELSKKMAAAERKMKSIEEALYPALEKAEGQFVRVEKLIVAFDPKKSQTPKWKEAFEKSLEMVDAKVRAMLEEFAESTRVTTKWLDVKEASATRTAGIFSTIADAFKSLWSRITGVKKSVDDFEKSVDALEKAMKG